MNLISKRPVRFSDMLRLNDNSIIVFMRNLKLWCVLANVCMIFCAETEAACDKELNEFLNCVSSFAQSDSDRYPYGVNFDQFSGLVSDCFTSNGCDAVKLDSPQEIFENPEKNLPGCKKLKRRKRAIRTLENQAGKEAVFTNWPDSSLVISDTSTFIGCNRKIRQEIRQETEQCMKQLVGPALSIPVENSEQVVDVPLDFILIDEYYSISVFNMTHDPKICKDPKSGRQLRTCLSALFNRVRDHVAVNAFEKRERLFNLRVCNTACLAKLGLCAENVRNNADAVCQCVPEEKKPFYRNMLIDCFPDISNSSLVDTVLNRNFNFVRSNVCMYDLEKPCS